MAPPYPDVELFSIKVQFSISKYGLKPTDIAPPVYKPTFFLNREFFMIN